MPPRTATKVIHYCTTLPFLHLLIPPYLHTIATPNPPIYTRLNPPMQSKKRLSIHPWEEEFVYPSMRRRKPTDTREDTVKKLFYSLNITNHMQTNNLHPHNHIFNEGLHVCIIPHHSRTKLHFFGHLAFKQLQIHSFYIAYALFTSYIHWPGVSDHFAPCLDHFPS